MSTYLLDTAKKTYFRPMLTAYTISLLQRACQRKRSTRINTGDGGKTRKPLRFHANSVFDEMG